MNENQRPLSQTAANGSSRRNFLKVSAAAAAMAAGGSALLRGAETTSTGTASDVPAAATAPRLRVALIGCGGQGRYDTQNLMSADCKVVALCDVDEKQIDGARTALAKHAIDLSKQTKSTTQPTADIQAFGDYRKLLSGSTQFDAVVVATPDHWHAPIVTAAIKAGKHVYCEKPLTHSVSEARSLRTLAASSKVVTQMGNQGSASVSLRRCMELIQAGALGQIRDVHSWLNEGAYPHAQNRPEGSDPVPSTLNWDFWCGPSPLRPFKEKTYHPYLWRGWKDFGSGQLGDFGCHSINLPMRALALEYPDKIELDGPAWSQEAYPNDARLRLHFAGRGKLDPVTLHWYDGKARPDSSLLTDVLALDPKLKLGTLIIGEKGIIFTNPWNQDGLIKLNDEAKLHDVTHHEATKDVPQTIPRVKNHYVEFVDACHGKGTTFSPFQVGGHLTEIILSGVIAMRLGKSITWDGAAMESPDEPEAGKLARMPWRKNWIG